MREASTEKSFINISFHPHSAQWNVPPIPLHRRPHSHWSTSGRLHIRILSTSNGTDTIFSQVRSELKTKKWISPYARKWFIKLYIVYVYVPLDCYSHLLHDDTFTSSLDDDQHIAHVILPWSDCLYISTHLYWQGLQKAWPQGAITCDIGQDMHILNVMRLTVSSSLMSSTRMSPSSSSASPSVLFIKMLCRWQYSLITGMSLYEASHTSTPLKPYVTCANEMTIYSTLKNILLVYHSYCTSWEE